MYLGPIPSDQITVKSWSFIEDDFNEVVQNRPYDVFVNQEAGLFLIKTEGISVSPPGQVHFDPDNALAHNFFWGKIQEGKAYQLHNQFMTAKAKKFLQQNPEIAAKQPQISDDLRFERGDWYVDAALAAALYQQGGPNFFLGGLSISQSNGQIAVQDKDGDQKSFTPALEDALDQIMGKLEFHPIPQKKHLRELGRFSDGRYLAVDEAITDYLVDAEDYSFGYGILIGKPGEMVPHTVLGCEFLDIENGQEVIFTTEDGQLTLTITNDPTVLTYEADGQSETLETIPVYQPDEKTSQLIQSLKVERWNTPIQAPDL